MHDVSMQGTYGRTFPGLQTARPEKYIRLRAEYTLTWSPRHQRPIVAGLLSRRFITHDTCVAFWCQKLVNTANHLVVVLAATTAFFISFHKKQLLIDGR